jgi:hypothetical protein
VEGMIKMADSARNKEKNVLLNQTILLAVISVFIFVLQIWHVNNLYLLYSLDDETGYWGVAASFAGYDWSSIMNYVSYYSYGYSFLLTPLYWIFDNPVYMYRAAIVMNGLFSVCTFWVQYRIVHMFFPRINKALQMGIPFCACVYSAYIVQSSVAWTEMWLTLVLNVVILLFIRLFASSSNLSFMGFGILLIYLFSIHQRTLGVAIAATGLLLLAVLNQRLSWNRLLYYLGGLLTGYIPHTLISSYLKTNVFNGDYASTGTFQGQIPKINSLITADGFFRLIKGLCGQIFYLGAASFLLFFMGAIYLLFLLYKRVIVKKNWKRMTHREYGALFVLLAAVGTIGISSISMLEGQRIDHAIYGRYNEIFSGIFICFGLGFIVNKKGKIIPAIISSCLTIALLAWVTDIALTERTLYNYLCAVGTWQYFSSGEPKMLVAVLVSVAVLLLICLLTRQSSHYVAIGTIAVCSGLFIWTGEGILTTSVLPGHQANYNAASMVYKLSQENIPVYYEISEYRWSKGLLQFFMKDRPLLCAKKEVIEKIPGEKYVFSVKNNPYAYDMLIEPPRYSFNNFLLFHIGPEGVPNQKIEMDDSYFLSQNRKDDLSLVSNGIAGYLTYGPYITLDKGSYSCNFELTFHNYSKEDIGYVEVASPDKIITSIPLHSSYFSPNNTYQISVPFSLTEKTSNLEFRVSTAEGSEIEVVSVSMEKTSDQFAITQSILQFHSHNDSLHQNKLLSNGNAGFLLFGNYLELTAGTYLASTELLLVKNLTNSIGYVDIVSDQGKTVLMKKELFASDFQDGVMQMKNLFLLSEIVDDVEFRLYVNEGTVLQVGDIRYSITDTIE